MTDKIYVVEEEELNIEKLEETINQIHESNTKLKESDIFIYKNEINLLLENFKKYNKKYKRKIKTSILSLIVSLSISIGISMQINKSNNNEIIYKSTKYTYVDDNVTQEEKRGKTNNSIIIKEYGYWGEDSTERINKIYDVSEYTFEDIKDYLSLDLASLDFTTETDSVKNYDTFESMNNEGEKILIKNVSEKDLSLEDLFWYSFCSLLILIAITIAFDFSAFKSHIREKNRLVDKYNEYYYDTNEIFDDVAYESINKIERHIKTYNFFLCFRRIVEKGFKDITLETLKRYLEKMKEPLTEILNEIEKNSTLRDEFVRLFNENAYLLNDPNLLMEKYNEALKEYDLSADKKYVDETVLELKRVLKEGENNAR